MLSQFSKDFNKFNGLSINSTEVVQLIFNELRNLGYSKFFNLSDSLSLNRYTVFNALMLLIGNSFSVFYIFVYLNIDLAKLIVKLALIKSILNVSKLNITNILN